MEDGSAARARIRDAALKQFGALGFKGATVRGIAQEAGVSPGLVQHHFASKQALREECDAYVRAFLRTALAKGAVGGAVTDAAFVADTHRTIALLLPYLATCLISDAPDAAAWFDDLVELHRAALTGGDLGTTPPPGADVPAIAAVYTAMQLGLAILATHVYRRLGADRSDPEATARVGLARLYLATEPVIGPELAGDIRDGLDRYRSGER